MISIPPHLMLRVSHAATQYGSTSIAIAFGRQGRTLSTRFGAAQEIRSHGPTGKGTRCSRALDMFFPGAPGAGTPKL